MTDEVVGPEETADPPTLTPTNQEDLGEAAASTATVSVEGPKPSGRRRQRKKITRKPIQAESEALDGFSDAAYSLYLEQINRYVIDLERFSRLKAKQGVDDAVSSRHVRDAAAFLSTSRVASRLSRYCETVGGLFLGGGISELIILVQTTKPPTVLIALTAVLIGIGAAMVGIFLGRE